MEKSQELEGFWNWIPAFRTVAEHQCIAAAAGELGVGRSAISRTIRLLEEELGTELFHRNGRKLRLSREGEAFLRAVRLGMRVIHEGFAQLRSDEPSGRFVVSSSGPCLHLLQPVLREAAERWPKLAIQVVFVPSAKTNAQLRRGEIDLALLTDPIPGDDIQLEHLCTLEHGIYCGPGHPLQGANDPDPARVLEHPFVAPHADAATGDPWPPSLGREVGLRVHQLSLALDVCASGRFLGVFPDCAVRRSGLRLERLPLDWIEPLTAYAARRVDVADGMPVNHVIARIRDQLTVEA